MRSNPARPLTGIAWMIATGLCFVAVQALVKHVGDALPAAQSAFLRYVLGLVFLLPMLGQLRAAPRHRAFYTEQGARGVIHGLGVILWFYAMTRITMAEVTAMNYMVPVYVTLGAALFLGERLALRRLLAIGLAFLGALIVLRPGLRVIETGHLAMIGTALCFAASYLMAKRMSGSLHPSVVVGWLSITVTLVLAPVAAAVWVPPTLAQLGWLFLVAAFATAGHYTMTLAFANAPVAVTQPVTFLQLVWSVTLGALLFGEALDPAVILGGGVIVASVIYLALREAQLRKRENRASAVPGAAE
jgi:drug/metabolite transporter (DMT)-like permease